MIDVIDLPSALSQGRFCCFFQRPTMEPQPNVDITQRARAGVEWEQRLWSDGFRAIAGLDEVGRGAWAGPVVAAAVILSPEPGMWRTLLGRVDDSKRLSPRRREELIGDIMTCSLSVGVGFSGVAEVDALGIVGATRLAMMRALDGPLRAPRFPPARFPDPARASSAAARLAPRRRDFALHRRGFHRG